MRSSPPSTLFRGWQRRVRSPLVWAGEYSYERDILRNIHPKNKAVVYAVRLVGCSQCPRSHALSPADHTRRAVLSTYKYMTTCQTRKCPSSHRDDQPGSAHTAYSRVCPSGWLRAPPLSGGQGLPKGDRINHRETKKRKERKQQAAGPRRKQPHNRKENLKSKLVAQ